MERKIRITFRWWNNDKSEIREDHIEILEEMAFNVTTYKIKEGYKAGELHADLDNIEYYGYWQYIMK